MYTIFINKAKFYFDVSPIFDFLFTTAIKYYNIPWVKQSSVIYLLHAFKIISNFYSFTSIEALH